MVVLVSPILLCMFMLNIPSLLAAVIRRDPTFKPPPSPKPEHPEDQAKAYADFARKELSDIIEAKRIDKSKDAYQYVLQRRDACGPQISFWQEGPALVGVDIEGFQCGTWHTAEVESLDDYFWIALAGLEDGAYYRRTLFGRVQIGIYMPKAKMWAVNDLPPFSVGPAFRKNFPRTNRFRSKQKI